MVSRKSIAIISAMLLAVAAPLFYGCGSGPGSDGLERKSSVSLELNWPSNYSFDSNTSQLNFTSSPKMSAAPAYVTSCRVTISGADMTSVTLDVPLSTGQVGGAVKPGERRFDVVVDTDIGLSFTGSTTAILVPGSNSGILIQLAVNFPPSLKISVSNPSPKLGEAVTVSVAVIDQDVSDTHTFTWHGGGGSIIGSGPSVTWVGNQPGSYTVSVTVDDGMGGVVTQSVVIGMINNPPVIQYVKIDHMQFVQGSVTIYLSCAATDADGDQLFYAWWDGKGQAINGQNVSFTFSIIAGQAFSIPFTCTVSDGKPGGTVSGSVTANVPATSSQNVWAVPGNLQNTVSWTPVSGASQYNLYWGTAPGVTTASNFIPVVVSPYTHTGLTNGIPYYYLVTAITGAGEIPLFPEASATPFAAAPACNGVFQQTVASGIFPMLQVHEYIFSSSGFPDNITVACSMNNNAGYFLAAGWVKMLDLQIIGGALWTTTNCANPAVELMVSSYAGIGPVALNYTASAGGIYSLYISNTGGQAGSYSCTITSGCPLAAIQPPTIMATAPGGCP